VSLCPTFKKNYTYLRMRVISVSVCECLYRMNVQDKTLREVERFPTRDERVRGMGFPARV